MLGIDYTSSQRYFIQCCIITENSRKINPFLKIFLQWKNGLLTHCFGHAKIAFFRLCEFLLPFWEADQKLITLVTCNIIIRIFPVMSAFFAMKTGCQDLFRCGQPHFSNLLYLLYVFFRRYSIPHPKNIMAFKGVGIVISYAPLFRTMKEKGITSYRLFKMGFPQSNYYAIKHGDNISTNTVNELCTLLQCSVSDIMEFIPEQKQL